MQNAVCFLKIPTLGASNSVWQMLFQALEEILTLDLKVAQITNVEVPVPAQHIPLQGFNKHLCNLITGINNRGQLVQGLVTALRPDQVVQFHNLAYDLNMSFIIMKYTNNISIIIMEYII